MTYEKIQEEINLSELVGLNYNHMIDSKGRVHALFYERPSDHSMIL